MNENEIEPGASGSGEPRPEDFVAPEPTALAPSGDPVDEPAPETTAEEGESMLERFVESEEMVELRRQAYGVVAARRTGEGGGRPLTHDEFKEQFYDKYVEIGQQVAGSVAPENRERAELEQAVASARFQQDCDFESYALNEIKALDSSYSQEGRPDLADALLDVWTESKITWVKPEYRQETGERAFAETAEMAALRSQIEQSQEFDPGLWAAYYEAGLAIADTEGGSALGKSEFQLAYAELKITAGFLDDAREDLDQLVMTPEMDQYREFAKRVYKALEKTTR